jgi:hypothetical protein
LIEVDEELLDGIEVRTIRRQEDGVAILHEIACRAASLLRWPRKLGR